MDDFRPLLDSVKASWPAMPTQLKAKITWSQNHVLLGAAAKFDSATSTAEDLKRMVKDLVDGHLPSSSSSPWDGSNPTFSDLLNEVFASLEDTVMQVVSSTGSEDIAAEKLNEAGAACAAALQDSSVGNIL